MKRTLLALTVLASAAVPALAQEAVDIEAEMAEASRKFEQWIQSTRTFIAGTTFNKGDVQSFIELWPELTAIETDEDEDEEIFDYAAVIDDPRYKAFAARHQLDGTTWLKKSVRILILVMRDQMSGYLADAEAQLPDQMAMLESQRSQYGEETYQQMKRSFEASAQMMKRQRAAWASLPDPTEREAALLAERQDELSTLLMAEDEEADAEWDE